MYLECRVARACAHSLREEGNHSVRVDLGKCMLTLRARQDVVTCRGQVSAIVEMQEYETYRIALELRRHGCAIAHISCHSREYRVLSENG